ncbi:Uncharacterized iron-regulated membrane protein [Arenibacter nanhaiticus]|uniref:Uncharacterized iron-regulated membrane protein n=1 Tax=Arenibacter nanhaiticus TaxID=558155 RepID=A0A1M6H078_9FLAO|nr:PepSY-associated TM helix domain-containing protein [Arenibacter nanhaiticus]SHJ15659.1 Uncharacterized iron-regulated membrane protein [Arenibacter nanhaiticus]
MKKSLRYIKKVHLWLGLSCGLLASISGLTGALYVWQPEIVSTLNPHLLQVPLFENISETSLHSTTAFLIEKHRDSIVRVNLPYREQQSISILFNNGDTHYYHPQNATYLGEKSTSILFFEDVIKIHRTLGIPDIGKYIVGGSTLVFFVLLLLSGFFMWYKAYGNNLKQGFKIKWKPKKKLFNYNLHKVLGICFFIPLLLMAFSGSYFTYHSYYKKTLEVFNTEKSLPQDKPTKTVAVSTSYRQYIDRPDPDYALRAIYFPKNSTSPYHFRYIKNRAIGMGLRKTKELKVDSAGHIQSLTAYDSDMANQKIAAQFYPFHIGEIAGYFGRSIVFLAGFVPAILYVSGIKIYCSKNKK